MNSIGLKKKKRRRRRRRRYAKGFRVIDNKIKIVRTGFGLDPKQDWVLA